MEYMLENELSFFNESEEIGIIGAKSISGIMYTFYVKNDKWTGFQMSYLSHSINLITSEGMITKWEKGLEEDGCKLMKQETTRKLFSCTGDTFFENCTVMLDLPDDLHARLIVNFETVK